MIKKIFILFEEGFKYSPHEMAEKTLFEMGLIEFNHTLPVGHLHSLRIEVAHSWYYESDQSRDCHRATCGWFSFHRTVRISMIVCNVINEWTLNGVSVSFSCIWNVWVWCSILCLRNFDNVINVIRTNRRKCVWMSDSLEASGCLLIHLEILMPNIKVFQSAIDQCY